MKQVQDLTCCRALFAASVFAYHVNLQCQFAPLFGMAGYPVQRGYLGVDGFFVLSGMVLAYAHPALALTWRDARQFWAKRLVRIYPVHIAMILAFLCLLGVGALLGLRPREPERFGLDELVNHLLLIHAWGASDRWAWNYPSWSISAEWAGYLSFPVLWMLCRRLSRAALWSVLPLALLALLVTEHYNSGSLNLTFDGALRRFFPEFIAGMATVPLVPALARMLPGRGLSAAGVIAALAGLVTFHDALAVAGFWALLAGLLVSSAQGGRALLGRVPGLVWLGEISYAFYMSFAFVETVQATAWRYAKVDPTHARLLYGVSTTALTFGLGLAAWWLIEQPALRAYAGRRRRPVQVPAPGVALR